MAEGEFALVRQHLEEALKTPITYAVHSFGDHDLYAMLADAAAAQRDEAALRHYAPLAEETAARYSHTLYQAIAHRAWGVAHRLVGEFDDSEARFQQALELFRALGAHWQIGRALVELGELALARTDTALARDHFSHALTEFEALKAAPDATRTRAALESLD